MESLLRIDLTVDQRHIISDLIRKSHPTALRIILPCTILNMLRLLSSVCFGAHTSIHLG